MPKSDFFSSSRRSSTISPIKRAKPTTTKTKAHVERLDDAGSITSLAVPGIRQDVVSLVKYIQQHTFDDIPERAGMNSTQISSTLRFRKTLPPIVSTAHLYALSASPTSTERELARLIAQGVVRKVSIPGRGKGGAAIGDGIALMDDWRTQLEDEESLSDELKVEYLALMRSHPVDTTITGGSLGEAGVRHLISSGFLTTPTALLVGSSNLLASPGGSQSLLNISSAGSKAATGTMAAVGGIGAVHESGGSGSMLATSQTRAQPGEREQSSKLVTFSLPNTGVFLKLLVNSRNHLLFLLKQMSPKWRESTIDLLREKWEGGIGSLDVSEKKRIRGEFNGVLPGKTRRWREFMGLQFDFVLAEALGSGMVELFDTGSVGLAVRAR